MHLNIRIKLVLQNIYIMTRALEIYGNDMQPMGTHLDP